MINVLSNPEVLCFPLLNNDFLQIILLMGGSLILVTVVNPYFLIMVTIMSVLFLLWRMVFLKSSKNIKRLEGISK